MSQSLYPVPDIFAASALITQSQYQVLYEQSINEPEAFWAAQAQRFLSWTKPFAKVCDADFTEGRAEWFADGQLNACVNCIDRHLLTKGQETAFIVEGDEPEQSVEITYRQLHHNVCKLANVLKAQGVKKGDRVCIYMPMIAEAAYAMLACARIGAVHSVVFGGFSPEALKDRILDADCRLVITANEGVRGGKTVPLKANVDQALEGCPNVTAVIVLAYTAAAFKPQPRDIDYAQAIAQASAECEPEPMNAEDPLFILYTSGSTGKPKGVLHTTGGYLLQAAMTFKYVFDYREGEVFWCTADVGWITGHSYCVYGPLAIGGTSVLFEGVPTYPTPSRCWEVVDTHKVSIFYTAPTVLRALMAQGDDFVTASSRNTLRVLGTVGEPINPEAWHWFYRVVGEQRCPIVDTWWQTETGAHMLVPLPGATGLKPGSAALPFFGVEPAIMDAEGNELTGECEGNLVIKRSWPSQIRTIYGDHQRLIDTYFSTYKGHYFTGDGARRDADGYYWITGRVDDVLNVSGHRLGTAEIESALVLHPQVAEAAVVGYPHAIKGQGVYAYITLMCGVAPEDVDRKTLIQLCHQEIGAIAKPDIIQWAPALPKTRSGKIMRRILRKIAEGELDTLGDTSTLADPSTVDALIANREGGE
ncbi:acetate--CoA ligase [Marinagarivorans algicola]|uniref:acetate--CoA ligase n=1 Tax=Marinagarivorans algicola TaxID=1513270 RepID=UPI0006B45E53|nr:acetate--CoA ligase [Marinagarivorans algicola]